MRRNAALVVLLLLPLAFLFFRGAQATGDTASVIGVLTPQHGAITGTVYLVSGPDRVPLAGAVVSVSGTDFSGLSGPDGRYGFRPLPPGTYTVRASKPGYLTGSVEATVTVGDVVVRDIDVRTSRYPVTLRRIGIRVNIDSARVTVSPDPLYIAPGDYVEWLIAGDTVYPWTVHFSPISPLTHRRILSNGEPMGGSVRADVFPGKYSYFVAVAVGDWVFTADPELIDENEEVRGGPH